MQALDWGRHQSPIGCSGVALYTAYEQQRTNTSFCSIVVVRWGPKADYPRVSSTALPVPRRQCYNTGQHKCDAVMYGIRTWHLAGRRHLDAHHRSHCSPTEDRPAAPW